MRDTLTSKSFQERVLASLLSDQFPKAQRSTVKLRSCPLVSPFPKVIQRELKAQELSREQRLIQTASKDISQLSFPYLQSVRFTVLTRWIDTIDERDQFPWLATQAYFAALSDDKKSQYLALHSGCRNPQVQEKESFDNTRDNYPVQGTESLVEKIYSINSFKTGSRKGKAVIFDV